MILKPTKKIFFIVLCLCIMNSFLSCESTDDSTSSQAISGSGAITLTLPGGTRAPATQSTPADVASFRISITCPDSGYTETKDALPGETIQFVNLVQCNYAVTVYALNATMETIFTGTEYVSVEPGITSNAVINLKHVSGSGTIELSVTFPGEVTSPVLHNLTIAAVNDTSITIEQPTFSTPGNPDPTVSAYIGLDVSVVDSNNTSNWAGDAWLTDYSKNWTADQWAGYYISIEGGDVIQITGNSSDTVWFTGNSNLGHDKAYQIISPSSNSITVSGTVVYNFIQGPIDVSAGSYQFTGLSAGTNYRIIVIAENSEGYSVKQIAQVTSGSGTVSGGIIQWQGTHTGEPVTCETAALNYAYYNSTEKKSYICDGAIWQILTQDGIDGVDGINGTDGSSCSVTDNGDGTKTISCTDGTSTIVSDGADGANGIDGTNGVDGANGADGSSCSVTDNGDGTKTISCTDGTSATVSNGADGINGIDGTNGVDGINGVDGSSCSVVDNGDGTKTISCTDGTSVTVSDGADGADGSNVTVNGTVANGSYLTLLHNLNRNDLTFTGQYEKNGRIYDYSDYATDLYKPIVGPTVFGNGQVYHTSATALTNGNAFIAYSDNNNSNYGTFVIYDTYGDLVAGPTVFSNEGGLSYISATTLANGNVFIAFRGGGSRDGYFVIYDASGNQVVGPTLFDDSENSIVYISTTALSNGNVLIAYLDTNSGYSTGNGYFVVYDASGNEVVGSTVFMNGNVSFIDTTTLTNGNVLIACRDRTLESYFVIYDASGNEVVGPTVFHGNASYISATALSNGNVFIAYRDGISPSHGSFVIYDASGNEVLGSTVFDPAGSILFISATTLSNGNVLIAYRYRVSNTSTLYYGKYVVYDKTGALVTGPKVFKSGDETSYISATTLANGKALIAYQDRGNSYNGTFIILNTAELALEKVSTNEVRLWNYTGETLDLFLTVHQ